MCPGKTTERHGYCENHQHLAVNWWYQKRREVQETELRNIEKLYKDAHDRREREYHEARMRKLLGNDEASGD